jgi:molybdate transport system substrate-binding protein
MTERSILAVVIGLAIAAVQSTPTRAQQPVRVFAAGSLSGVMVAVGAAVARDYGITITLTSGGSGTLRERIEKGEPVDLFASANMDHPLALTKQRLSGPTVLFTRNSLCAYSRPDVRATRDTLLERMLEPSVKLATSTPGADPAGDYAWKLFHKAEAVRKGASARLERKAQQVMGGPTPSSPVAVPAGRNLAGFLLESRAADIVLLYCSGATAVRQDLPGAVIVEPPPALAVAADYGLTVMKNAPAAAGVVAAFIQSPEGQRILTEAGFVAVALPSRPD